MNYNKFSKPPKYSHQEINSRAKLDTGTHCNYKCGFCYYIEDLDKVTSLEIIKERVDIIFKSGIKEIDLSGGESTIHKNWFEILEYCHSKFLKVSCLSNGSKLASYEFAEKSQKYGLSEVLFSLHGHDEKSHDYLVQHKNAFKHIIQAIENCNILGIKVRLNCTVSADNHFNMEEYTTLIKKLNVQQINFLPLNYWNNASKLQTVGYEELSKSIKYAIDKLHNSMQVNVRYIPFCFMKGYEKYVVGTYQHIHDLEDWNLTVYESDTVVYNTVEAAYAKAFENRNHSYVKPKECFECKFFNICDGIETKLKDTQSLYPELGEKIQDVMKYRTGDRS